MMTSDFAQRGLYKTGDGWVQTVAGDRLRRVRAQAYIASGALPPLEHLPLRPGDPAQADKHEHETEPRRRHETH